MTMVNKKEISDRIAEKTGFYKKDVKMMLSAFADVLEESLSDGDIYNETSHCKCQIQIYSIFSENGVSR